MLFQNNSPPFYLLSKKVFSLYNGFYNKAIKNEVIFKIFLSLTKRGKCDMLSLIGEKKNGKEYYL